jgi:hypothetical protein
MPEIINFNGQELINIGGEWRQIAPQGAKPQARARSKTLATIPQNTNGSQKPRGKTKAELEKELEETRKQLEATHLSQRGAEYSQQSTVNNASYGETEYYEDDEYEDYEDEYEDGYEEDEYYEENDNGYEEAERDNYNINTAERGGKLSGNRSQPYEKKTCNTNTQ